MDTQRKNIASLSGGLSKQQEPHRRWIALLALFTGARANEICQLYADYVQQVDGIWCLNIRSGRPDQKLKTANSARLVPLHRHLLQAGFIEFVKDRAGGGTLHRVTSSSGRIQPFVGGKALTP